MTQPPGQYGGPPGSHSGAGYGQPSAPPAGYGNPYAQPGGYGAPPGGGYGGPGYPHGMPAPGFPPPAPRKSRTGLAIGIVAGVLALLLCGGGAVFYFRGGAGASTTATVEGFLKAVFNDRDIDAAKQYVCAEELSDIERDYASSEVPDLNASWSNLEETANDGSEAKVSAKMSVQARAKGQTSTVTGTWVFLLKNQSGWKVCDIDTDG